VDNLPPGVAPANVTVARKSPRRDVVPRCPLWESGEEGTHLFFSGVTGWIETQSLLGSLAVPRRKIVRAERFCDRRCPGENSFGISGRRLGSPNRVSRRKFGKVLFVRVRKSHVSNVYTVISPGSLGVLGKNVHTVVFRVKAPAP